MRLMYKKFLITFLIITTYSLSALAEKVIVFKFKRRKGYQKKNGHRQKFSIIEISNLNKKIASKKTVAKKTDTKTATKKTVAKKITTKKITKKADK